MPEISGSGSRREALQSQSEQLTFLHDISSAAAQLMVLARLIGRKKCGEK